MHEQHRHIRIIEESGMTAGMDEAIRRLLGRCFPTDSGVFSRTRFWNGCVPVWSVVMESGGELIGHTAVIERYIGTESGEYRIAGIGNVCIDPARRGQRLSDQILARTMDEAGKRHYDLCFLFCSRSLKSIYERVGWIVVDPPSIYRIKPDGQKEELFVGAKDKTAMFYPLKTREFPAGPINLGGRDW
jgi:predicted N-acetyltransferase YhbS